MDRERNSKLFVYETNSSSYPTITSKSIKENETKNRSISITSRNSRKSYNKNIQLSTVGQNQLLLLYEKKTYNRTK